VVTALSAGTCSITAERAASGFATARIPEVTFKVFTAAETKAIADDLVKAAEKAASEARAAVEKAAAEKAAAEAKAKALAEEQAAAAAAIAEAARLAALSTVTSVKTVTGKTSIALNLADKYSGAIMELQVRTVVSGKVKFVRLASATITRADGVLTVGTKAKLVKGQQMRIVIAGKVVLSFVR
jgi:membrane protein involved in colicin uptake